MSTHWKCPYCNRDTTINDDRYSEEIHYFNNDNKDGWLAIKTAAVVCPNSSCKEYSIIAFLHRADNAGYGCYIDDSEQDTPLSTWHLRPQSSAQPFPEYVPVPIRKDYEEACSIKLLSPKASATLARRCLQGIIRDFWGISKGRLIDEIKAIEDKTDPLTWQAIDSVRKIGNIGAHMERDINVIVEVDDSEAGLLINLIEILIKDWYVTRHDRETRLSKIIGIADTKDNEKKGMG